MKSVKTTTSRHRLQRRLSRLSSKTICGSLSTRCPHQWTRRAAQNSLQNRKSALFPAFVLRSTKRYDPCSSVRSARKERSLNEAQDFDSRRRLPNHTAALLDVV